MREREETQKPVQPDPAAEAAARAAEPPVHGLGNLPTPDLQIVRTIAERAEQPTCPDRVQPSRLAPHNQSVHQVYFTVLRLFDLPPQSGGYDFGTLDAVLEKLLELRGMNTPAAWTAADQAGAGAPEGP